MALISLRQLLDHAAEQGYGVPAFNVNNLEQMRAIMLAAAQTDSPVIVQASAGARKYAGAPFLRHLIQAAIEDVLFVTGMKWLMLLKRHLSRPIEPCRDFEVIASFTLGCIGLRSIPLKTIWYPAVVVHRPQMLI